MFINCLGFGYELFYMFVVPALPNSHEVMNILQQAIGFTIAYAVEWSQIVKLIFELRHVFDSYDMVKRHFIQGQWLAAISTLIIAIAVRVIFPKPHSPGLCPAWSVAAQDLLSIVFWPGIDSRYCVFSIIGMGFLLGTHLSRPKVDGIPAT